MVMELPVQITFRNMAASPAVETRIREEAAKLETFYDRITSCRVVMEIPHQHHEKGNHFHVRIDIGVPGGEVVVRHEPDLHSSIKELDDGARAKSLEASAPHKDAYVAIRDAFKAARRRLQDRVARERAR